MIYVTDMDAAFAVAVQVLKGDDLAERAHMSPSTFRQHFRALTGVSPLHTRSNCDYRKPAN